MEAALLESGSIVANEVALLAKTPQSLDTLVPGQRGVVTSLRCANRELRNKLLTMGLVAGAAIEVANVAPFGDPMTIRLLRFSLSLRLSEASHVFVTLQP